MNDTLGDDLSNILKINSKITKEKIISKEINILPNKILVFQDESTVQAAALITEKKREYRKKLKQRKICISIRPIDAYIENSRIVVKHPENSYDRSHLIPNQYIDSDKPKVLILWDSDSNQNRIENSIRRFEIRVEKKVEKNELEFPFYWFTTIDRFEENKAQWKSYILKEGEGTIQEIIIDEEPKISSVPYVWDEFLNSQWFN
ncbi:MULTISPECIES: hypothetical protein [Lactococcus]|uniref:Uncharacterized protein n=1 Tax=Lactococcus petauri TaxID=1940789 RepID=A0AAJ2J011_9LACT|nr:MULTISPECIES: hypothetical protein [Lactococcus]MCO7181316.1 hypothetical protein [Lactococcus formosensis]MDT2528007.1 hypothetical protein [Lactococcus petauri]MDT2542551.1 hypothetical protein [Lactococcus petauri]MDT2552508.1 hypothetical protein [Lactococcus petauri]MDT2559151.1 hypothetical protein [Lactococcus petauri]